MSIPIYRPVHFALAILAILVACSVQAQEKPAKQIDIFTISDNFLVSGVAARMYLSPDEATEKAFLANLIPFLLQ